MNTDRAVEIGRETLAINAAIDELAIAFGNNGMNKYQSYDTNLFSALSDRRESLRGELLAMTVTRSRKLSVGKDET